MKLSEDRERVKVLLKDTITLLCKNGLDFKEKFSLEALIGVTLDEKDVFLVSLNQVVNLSKTSSDDNHGNHSSNHDDGSNNDSDKEIAPKRHKRQKRRHPTSGQTHNAASTHTTQTYSNNTASRQTPQASDPHVKVESSNQSGCHLSEEHPELDLTASNADLKSEQSITMVKAVPNTTETGDLMIVSMVKEESVYALHGEVTPEHVCVTSQDIHGANIPRTNPQGTFSADWITAQGISTPTVSMATQGDTQSGSEQINADNCENEFAEMIPSAPSYPRNYTEEKKVALVWDKEINANMRICQYEGCKFSTPFRNAMSRHQRRHANYYVLCPTCGKQFSTKSDLEAHVASVHEKLVLYCKHCDKKFSTRTGLSNHEKKHGKGTSYRFICQFCNKGYNRLHNYKKHMEQHPQYQENTELQSAMSERVEAARNHTLQNEKSGKLRACPVEGCDYSSLYRSSIIRHKKRHHTKSYMVCPICNKKFVENYNFRQHFEMAHGAKQQCCDRCGKVLRSPKSLLYHKASACRKKAETSMA